MSREHVGAGLQPQVDQAVQRLRAAATDLQAIEVKSAAGGMPKSIAESVSAFANARGGLVLLGLSDGDFLPAAINAKKLADDLASVCANELEPPIRAEIDIAKVDGQPVVAAAIDELPAGRKPCYLKSKRLEGGSYIRTHDGDRRLSFYEIHILMSGRGQPLDDIAVVDGAKRSDLDENLVSALLNRIRSRRGSALADRNDDDILRILSVTSGEESEPYLTLAGLLALGRYPQQFFPQLNVTFVAFPTATGRPMRDGTRFLDNVPIDGPIPSMIAEAQAAVRRNTTRRAEISGDGRLDLWEYPDEAVRETVVNALLHRDYHPSAHGSQVRIELYPDRLEVVNPGGLHGQLNRDHLFARPVTSSRNSRLAKLLEDIEIPHTNRAVCENRGSGLLAVAASLQDAGLDIPLLEDRIGDCSVTIRGRSYLANIDDGTLPDQPQSPQGRQLSHTTSTRNQIARLLINDALSTGRLAEELGISRQSVLRWLKIMEKDGQVEPTEATPQSPRNRWRLAAPESKSR
ncbi:MAG: putative DNA binding domain-containing protein [bacterium]|nr:putative DNA binding domain-containing protein [bacterium]